MSLRSILRINNAVPVSDGAGVALMRAVGMKKLDDQLDPFLMLDHISSKNTKHMPGFPDHPHRGFETVTIVKEGVFEHKDSMGNHGVLKPGDVQWMTAGSGIIHSEMPGKDYEGPFEGYQIWVNLPKKHKMCKPRYQDVASSDIPSVQFGEGSTARVVSGAFGGVTGPITEIVSEPTLFDANDVLSASIPPNHTCFAFVAKGVVSIGGKLVEQEEAAILTKGDTLEIAGVEEADLLVLAGAPLDEPEYLVILIVKVAKHGPFVMTTEAELQNAFREYSNGKFIKHHP